MRRSRRQSGSARIPYRIQRLFHGVDGGDPVLPNNRTELLHSDPNIYIIRDFLSVTELDYFDKICTAYISSFKKSFTERTDSSEVLSNERTSQYIHLSKSQDRYVRSIEQRAADFVGLSPQNCEPLQIVSYCDGQKFELHHDAGTLIDTTEDEAYSQDQDKQAEEPPPLQQQQQKVELVYPRRLITFFVYLNTLPEGQGSTEFPLLQCASSSCSNCGGSSSSNSCGLSIQPVRGSAVMFCNVQRNGEGDVRTSHRAQPVAAGLTKYGVNLWLTDANLQDLAQVTPRLTISAAKARCNEACYISSSQRQSALVAAEKQTADFIKQRQHANSSPAAKRRKLQPPQEKSIDERSASSFTPNMVAIEAASKESQISECSGSSSSAENCTGQRMNDGQSLSLDQYQ